MRSLAFSLSAAGTAALIVFLSTAGLADANALDECVQSKLATADDSVTVGDLRRQCLQNAVGVERGLPDRKGAVEQRLEAEKKNVLRPFSIMPHRPNYILPGAWNSKGYNAEHHRKANGDSTYDFDSVEAQFQISIKTPLVVGLFDDSTDIFAAYTNHSFWQVYNDDISAAFRETNHEPEIWVQFNPRWELLGIVNASNSFGINHQSNGQSSALSRSWNRLFASLVFEYGNLGFIATPWYRIPESEGDDDNPDITKYMGHYELGATYKWDDHTFSLMTRNALESNYHRGSFQFSWSFPMGDWPFLRGYVQYYNGYGESLVDYDQYVNRVGVGLSLTDWL
ncbi:Phospholipase A(1) [Desulfobulbus propionicus DSM 2032]|uniref:Phosphatidylcholine 1-acylhydrolase n=1 Tax=Desulfobulbus propionicus (strain ATCC 33891 / DSM 2032 / VKM B-1956 / 1pr3) TaxID=577650 RepID=A0A7U3YM99_DESPD|nr:phospholipase A [Desulfobulbus propionicus]ADW17991.1 Phospholipase A(1) [Desulfobulbus propionicus DSM 2032]